MKFCGKIKKLFKKKEDQEFFPIVNTNSWSKEEILLLLLINDYRNSFDLKELNIDLSHYKASQQRTLFLSEEFKKTQTISHSGMIESINKLRPLGVKHIAENLGFGYKNAQGCFNGWVNSEKHNSILLGNWVWCGISIYYDLEIGKKIFCLTLGK